MKIIKLNILFFLLLVAIISRAQSNTLIKKDTLYYLIDTAKTQKLDRMIWINNVSPNYIDYNILCPCLGGSGIEFHYPVQGDVNDTSFHKPIYIKKEEVSKMSFIWLSKLIKTAYDHDKDFANLYIVYFIEHLPNGKYVKREVRYSGAVIIEE